MPSHEPVISVVVLFALMERGMDSLFPRGDRKCSKAMRRLDAAYSARPEVKDTLGEAGATTRTLLRVRCGLCTNRCKRPLKRI